MADWEQLHRVADKSAVFFERAFTESVLVADRLIAGRKRFPGAKPKDSGGWLKVAMSAWTSGSDVYRQKVGGLVQEAIVKGAAIGDVARNVKLDAKNPLAIRFAERHTFNLVENITTDQRQMLRGLIRGAMREGLPSRKIADRVRGSFGINTRQQRALVNYRGQLEKQGLSAARVDAAVAKRRERYRSLRAEAIARTESMRATNMGQQLLWQQAVERGQLDATGLIKTWIVTPDDRLCKLCREMGTQRVDVLGEFDRVAVGEVAEATITVPPLHPLCRCTVGLKKRDGAAVVVKPPPPPPPNPVVPVKPPKPKISKRQTLPPTTADLITDGAEARAEILKFSQTDERMRELSEALVGAQARVKRVAGFNIQVEIIEARLKSLERQRKTARRSVRSRGWAKEMERAELRRTNKLFDDEIEAVKKKVIPPRVKGGESWTYVDLVEEQGSSRAHLESVRREWGERVLERFIYNKKPNAMIASRVAPNVKVSDEARQALEQGRSSFLRMIDDELYATTIEGKAGHGVVVKQASLIDMEFVKTTAPKKKQSVRAHMLTERDRQYMVKLDFTGTYDTDGFGRNGFQSSTVHEMGHTVEQANPGLLAEAISWRDGVTEGEKTTWLGAKSMTGNPNYEKSERGYRDGDASTEIYTFKPYGSRGSSGEFHAFAAKPLTPHPSVPNMVYTERDGWQDATEVVTVGLQHMFEDPVKMAQREPQLFDFVFERVVRRKHTGASSRFTLTLGDQFELHNTPSKDATGRRKWMQERFVATLDRKGFKWDEIQKKANGGGQLTRRLYELRSKTPASAVAEGVAKKPDWEKWGSLK